LLGGPGSGLGKELRVESFRWIEEYPGRHGVAYETKLHPLARHGQVPRAA